MHAWQMKRRTSQEHRLWMYGVRSANCLLRGRLLREDIEVGVWLGWAGLC